MNYSRLVKSFLRQKISAFFAYRFAAFIRIIASAISTIVDVVLLIIIYSSTKGLPGWTFNELLFFNGTATLSWGITTSVFFPMVWYIGWRIDEGYFDHLLIRPIKIIPQMMIESMNVFSIPHLIYGIIIISYALINNTNPITIAGVLSYILLIGLACLVMYGIAGIMIGLSFKYFKVHQLMNLFWEVNRLSEYPINIYKFFIPFFLTFIMPLAIANYYPASFLLGKTTDYWLLAQLTLIGLAFWAIGTITIKWGLKHYSSAGG